MPLGLLWARGLVLRAAQPPELAWLQSPDRMVGAAVPRKGILGPIGWDDNSSFQVAQCPGAEALTTFRGCQGRWGSPRLSSLQPIQAQSLCAGRKEELRTALGKELGWKFPWPFCLSKDFS